MSVDYLQAHSLHGPPLGIKRQGNPAFKLLTHWVEKSHMCVQGNKHTEERRIIWGTERSRQWVLERGGKEEIHTGEMGQKG